MTEAAYIQSLVSGIEDEKRSFEAEIERIRREISDRDAAIARLVGLPPVAPRQTARKSRTMRRLGRTPDALLLEARKMFGARGFTVNEFVARAHLEQSPTYREGVRQLLQALVAERRVSRGSRCDPGYRTEIEYTVLDVGRPNTTGALLASIRDDVRGVVAAAVEAGWRPSAPRYASARSADVVWFSHPERDDKRFLVASQPRTEGWRNNLIERMARVGAPAGKE